MLETRYNFCTTSASSTLQLWTSSTDQVEGDERMRPPGVDLGNRTLTGSTFARYGSPPLWLRWHKRIGDAHFDIPYSLHINTLCRIKTPRTGEDDRMTINSAMDRVAFGQLLNYSTSFKPP
eukprot:scaffold2318_cov363-Pavlova_lutheri.AAC.2